MFTNDAKHRLVWNAMPDIFNAPQFIKAHRKGGKGNIIYIISYITNIYDIIINN